MRRSPRTLRWLWRCLVALAAGQACGPPSPTPETAVATGAAQPSVDPLDIPSQFEAPAEPSGRESPAPLPPQSAAPTVRPETLEIAKDRDSFVLTASHPVGGLALLPDGLALVHGGSLWLASTETRELTEIDAGVDPHALASDGRWLYWLGDERNGKLNLSTHETDFLPRFGRPQSQQGLAAGDALYGLGADGEVFRLDKLHPRLANPGDRRWQTMGGIQAGDHIFAFSAIDRVEMEAFLWRREDRRKGLRVEADLRHRHAWSLAHDGRLVFFRGEQVMLLSRRAKSPRPLFDKADLSGLCWCGKDVCGVSESAAELRLRAGESDPKVIATGVGRIEQLRCDAEKVAWTKPGIGKSTEVHLAPLIAADAPPGEQHAAAPAPKE